MSPYEKTLRDWMARPRELPLEYYERAHKFDGYYFCTPDYFVMGRPVGRDWGERAIKDVRLTYPLLVCDTWFIFLLTGDLHSAVNALPYPLPWIAFVRDDDPEEAVRFYPTARLLALARGGKQD